MNAFIKTLAETSKISADKIGIKDPITNTNSFISGVLTPVYTWAGVICIVIIIVAGYFYVTSSGNAAKVKRAKDAIVGAIVGLVIIMLAFVITQFVIGRF